MAIMAVEKCTIIVIVFSCHRKYILCWAYLVMELMFSFYT